METRHETLHLAVYVSYVDAHGIDHKQEVSVFFGDTDRDWSRPLQVVVHAKMQQVIQLAAQVKAVVTQLVETDGA